MLMKLKGDSIQKYKCQNSCKMFKRYKVELSPEVYCAVLVNWYVKYISLLLNIVCNVAIYNSIKFLSLKEGSCCSGKWKQTVTLY